MRGVGRDDLTSQRTAAQRSAARCFKSPPVHPFIPQTNHLTIERFKIDDIEGVVHKFNEIVGALTKKQGNVLEYTASSFDRDYVQFKSQVRE